MNLYGSASDLRVAMYVRGKERTKSLVFVCASYYFTIGLLLVDSSNLKAEYDSNNVQQKQKIGCYLVVVVHSGQVYDD